MTDFSFLIELKWSPRGSDWRTRNSKKTRPIRKVPYHKISTFNIFTIGFIGTTQKGIGPTYANDANRIGLRFGNLKNWSVFKERYMYLYETLKREKGIQYDYKKELKTYKKLGKIMIEKGWICDTVALIHKEL